MAPERKHHSSPTFTIRLGIGSVILAALITFVGLAWIFFLGVMAGRMYYGVDTTAAQNANHNQQMATMPAPPPSAMMPNEQATGKTENPTLHKSNSTYHPVIKEDSMAERVAQGQEPFVGDDFESIQKIDELAPPAELGPKQKTESSTGPSTDFDAENSLTTSKSESRSQAHSHNDKSIPNDATKLGLSQGSDFIEKVITEPSQEITSTPTPLTNAVGVQGTVQNELPSTSTASKQTVDTPHQTPDAIDETSSSVEDQSIHTTQVKNDSTEKTLLPETQDNTNTEETSGNQAIFDYTYQLATFKNPASAHSITDELVADGLNATTLSEEKNGTTFYYILVYHRGPEHSKTALEEILARHHFTDFIVRSKVVQ